MILCFHLLTPTYHLQIVLHTNRDLLNANQEDQVNTTVLLKVVSVEKLHM